MGSYVPNTSEEQQEMLREIGFDPYTPGGPCKRRFKAS